MLRQGIVLAFLTLSLSSAQANIVKARNGAYVAHAIVCKNEDASVKSAELLDIFEARTKYELTIVTQGPTIDANLSAVQKKLIAIFKDAGLKNLPSTYIDDIVASLSLDTKDISTLPTNATTTTPTPQGCELLPVAFYENATDLIVYSELWNKMDGLNKAGVIAHSAIYRHESELGDANVDRIRKIVGYLFSDTKLNSLNQDVPADANVCSAFDRYDATRVFFEFFKYDDPKNELQEILQFTKFRGVHPYGLTRVTTPKWAWPKQQGDLFLEVDSPIEQFSELYIRREWKATGVLDNYFFDEVNGDFQVRCAKSTDADLAILKIIFTSNFEPIAVGGARMLTFEISNVGKGKSVAMIASGLDTPFGFLGGKYPGTGGTCASSLQPGATCTLNIVFAPTVAGKSTDTLVIDFNDGATKQQISIGMEGTSLSPAELTISGGAAVVHNFGTNAMGVVKDQSFTITNAGGVRATNMQGLGLASPFVFRGGNYPGTGGTCTANLEPKGTCSVVVSYVPTQVGTHKDTMQLSYASGAVTQTLNKDLSGVAVKPALLTISESDPYDFGVVATGAIKTITLTVANIGEHGASNIYGLGLSAPFAFAGGFSYPGKGGTCGFNIGIGAKCTIILQFVPTGSGNAADTVELQYNNGVTNKVSQRSLAGVGATPALLIISDGPDYNFGFAYPGTSLDHTFTVTNTGATAATKVASLSINAPFVLEGGFPGKGGTCGQSLGAGASCTFVVTFAPDKVASYKEAFNLTYQNGVDVKTATRELSGLAGQAAELVMTTGTIYSFGDTDLGISKEIELVIVNTGGSPAVQLQDGGGLTEPYSYKGGSYPGVGGTCSSELAPNELCTVVVTYMPQKTGMHKETLALSYFNGHSKQYVLQYFEGTGVSHQLENWSPWNFFALSEK